MVIQQMMKVEQMTADHQFHATFRNGIRGRVALLPVQKVKDNVVEQSKY